MRRSSDEVMPKVDAAGVIEFLRAHPRFLAENPELYRSLAPPARVHGAPLADHMAAMLNAERAHAHAMAEKADLVLAAGRAMAGLSARVQEAVLALIQASSLVECIAHELPALLAVDAVSLCIEADRPGLRRLPDGTVAELMGASRVVFDTDADHAAMVHGEAMLLARHEALIVVPGNGPPCLLALAARDSATLDPLQGTAALAFLGRAVAAVLQR
jgi:uncharacterized protein YigA (DUF484 family)